MTAQLPSKVRLAQIASFSKSMALPPSHDEIEAMARALLAAYEQEPVAYMCDGDDGREYNGHNEFSCGGRGVPLYAHPAPSIPAAITGDGIKASLSLTQIQIDWICNTCASIYHTSNDDVAQGYIDAIRATLERITSIPAVPEGWKLVPIDPTKDMLRAGQSVVGFWLNTLHCYAAMLSAAPDCRAAMLNGGKS